MSIVYFGIALLAGSILLLEVALTRVFAIMLWHHLSYMVISVAMLGLGAAGAMLTCVDSGAPDGPQRGDSRAMSILAVASGLYGLTVIASLWIVVQIPIETLTLLDQKSELLKLGALYLVIAVPFFFGGAAISLALTHFVKRIGRVYFSDLIGSAIGACVGVLLLAAVGSGATVLVTAGLGLLASACFALAAERSVRFLSGVVALAAALLFLGVAGGLTPLGIEAWRPEIPFAPGKELHLEPPIEGIDRLFSSTAEVQVVPESSLPGISGGEFGKLDPSWIIGRFVAQDGTAPTALYSRGAELDRYPQLDDSQTAAAYVAMKAREGGSPDVLVIGVGGGLDVMIALAHGAESVTAVEFNQAMIEMVTERYDDYIGGLFTPGAHPLADRISLEHGEGRSYVRSHPEHYDVIQMAGVDSFTALSTGAYTLAESYLYTTEAVKDFYSKLKEGGYLSYSRFIMRAPRVPRETIRLVAIAAAALREMGVPDPEKRIVVFQAWHWAATLVKKGPFVPAEIEALRSFAEREGFVGLVYDPLARTPEEVGPGANLVSSDRDARVARRALFWRLLRGDEDEREDFIEEYPYDVTPSTDDAPFFFNYYRYGALFSGGLTDPIDPADRYHPDIPVGHVVLVASLAQVGLMAGVLILVPLFFLRRTQRVNMAELPPVFGYFAALGAGFMFIEIALMQKMILFLGHPTYAVTVVLATLLAGAGVGSLASDRWLRPARLDLGWLLIALIALLLINMAASHWLLGTFLGLPFAGRVIVAIALPFPLALVLGMPFPLGMRMVNERNPGLLPWAWSINAFLSVLSSTLSILLAMALGFSAVLWIAAALYVLGFAGMSWSLPGRAGAQRAK